MRKKTSKRYKDYAEGAEKRRQRQVCRRINQRRAGCSLTVVMAVAEGCGRRGVEGEGASAWTAEEALKM
jgi:hypothetical protein